VVELMVLFSKRLKMLRLEANMTQEQLGNKINVTKACISSYESGNRMASMETLIDIANLFKVDLDYLIGTDDYVVSDKNENYGIRMSHEEIDLILELRKHSDLYNFLIDDTKRTIEYIEKKIR
jgi:transcriptional regulator with XRE-family HTH domain